MFFPIAHHGFLNVRAYVRRENEPGIYFLAEWLDNRWALPLGPPIFGLPYRWGRLRYLHDHENGKVRGEVIDAGLGLSYQAHLSDELAFAASVAGSLDEFLLERYTAFTRRGARSRLFRVWHEPWLQVPLEIAVEQNRLLTVNWSWFKDAILSGAHYSPGAFGVWMGRPHGLTDPPARHISTTFFELP